MAEATITPATARGWRMPKVDPYAAIGLTIYAIFLVVALFADQIATHDPLEILFDDDGNLLSNVPAGAVHVLGTTNLGRDIFSQVVMGTRSALIVGVSAAIVVASLGTLVGLVAGFFGRWVDTLLMRIADVALGIPFLPFVIVLAAFMGAKTSNVVIAVALLLWPNTARVVRSQVLTVRERAFIEAARVTDLGFYSIVWLSALSPFHFFSYSLALAIARNQLRNMSIRLSEPAGMGTPIPALPCLLAWCNSVPIHA